MVQSRSAPIQAAGEATRRPNGLAKRLPYKKEDYPNIAYWTRKNYDDARNQIALVVVHDAGAETTKLPFIEHEDGTPLTEQEAVTMRATARGIFAHFLHEGTAPAKWGQVSVVGQDFFFNAIAERHPHAAMCEDMWKIQLLATTCYPSWHRNNRDKIERKRQELLWIQQQLEHGRQLKEELIENVERVGGNSKRDRSAFDTDDISQPKPFKKAKSSSTRLGSSVSGMTLAPLRISVPFNGASQQHISVPPSLASGPPPSSYSVSQCEPLPALLALSGPLPSLDGSPVITHGRRVMASAPSTLSGPSPSLDRASQSAPVAAISTHPTPVPSLDCLI